LSFEDFVARLETAREKVASAAKRAGRDPGEVTLIAVTKGHDFSAMTTALSHGVFELGENRVQEALPKLDRLDEPAARVHLIGQLQTNKVNKVVGRFASIMGVDRDELLSRIARRAVEIDCVQPVWIQVNTSDEHQKAGCAPGDCVSLVETAVAESSLEIRGLMTMGRADAPADELRRSFSLLRDLRDRHFPEGSLSMGMSGDFEIAVEEGATHVRLGTTLFGPRPPRP